MTMNMKKFSVLLLYPDYVSDGVETFFAHVRAADKDAAILKAQNMAARENIGVDQPEDFAVLIVSSGWISNL
jgi:hypothetical protein